MGDPLWGRPRSGWGPFLGSFLTLSKFGRGEKSRFYIYYVYVLGREGGSDRPIFDTVKNPPQHPMRATPPCLAGAAPRLTPPTLISPIPPHCASLRLAPFRPLRECPPKTPRSRGAMFSVLKDTSLLNVARHEQYQDGLTRGSSRAFGGKIIIEPIPGNLTLLMSRVRRIPSLFRPFCRAGLGGWGLESVLRCTFPSPPRPPGVWGAAPRGVDGVLRMCMGESFGAGFPFA